MATKAKNHPTPETAPAKTETANAAPMASHAMTAPTAPTTPATPAAPAAAPATSAPAKTETAKEKKLLFADMMAMSIDALKGYVKGAVKLFERIETARKGERDERKQNAKFVAELRRRYALGKDGGTIPSDHTFPKYAENIGCGKIPGRLQSLAALFNSLVLMNGTDGKPLITETIYDAAALDWLEKANAIVNAAQKTHGEQWKSCQDVQECIAALSTPGDAAEKLDAIRKRQKGETPADETAGDVAPLTAERAVEFLIAFYDTQASLVATKPENAKEIFCQSMRLAERLAEMEVKRDAFIASFSANYTKETVNGWIKAMAAGVADHMEILGTAPNETPTTPAAPATDTPAETPATEESPAAAPTDETPAEAPAELELATV
jgi:hypothetical protein